MKTIPLTRGQVALVDDADFAWLSQWRWYARRDRWGMWYAVRHGPCPERKNIFMHRIIAGTQFDEETDHVDGNGLNNQRYNLRRCTKAQNQWNRGVNRKNTSGYKGVAWHKPRQKWQVYIRVNGKQAHVGLFKSLRDAVIAYNDAARKTYGVFARLNPLPGETTDV